MKNLIIIALFFIGFTPTNAQQIHAILAGSTNVSDIGKGCEISIKKMESALEYIEAQTGIDVKIIKITGNKFTKDNIIQEINNLNPKADDVVFFFSTSHGFNYNDMPSQYAFISAHPTKNEMSRRELQVFGLSLEQEVYQPLRDKGARLTITLAEACNTVVDIAAPSSYQVMNVNIPKRLKELFLEQKGGVIASSSQINQRSWTDEENGGIYTNMFIEAMNTVITDSKKATWDDVMTKTNEYTKNYAASEGIRGGQNPISETDVNKHDRNNRNQNRTTTNRRPEPVLVDTPIKLIEEEETKKTTSKKNDYVAPKVKVKRKKGENIPF
ncbi:MAG: caspase family protein [Saprospiraceae bacterium]